MAGQEFRRMHGDKEKLKRVECPEPVEGLSWVYMLLIRKGMLAIWKPSSISEKSRES
ncbi:MAG: hypothetical protein ACFE0O_10675 [Opitutales bacterium]